MTVAIGNLRERYNFMLQSSNFELEILVHGSKVRHFEHEGRIYIEGKEGSPFEIRIKNNTPKRVIAVLTVDGLSVVDGKEGSFGSGGYILDPWASTKIPGWRLNNKEVANFEFTSPGKSYAAKRDSGNNLGVIGCAFFYEKVKTLDYNDLLEQLKPTKIIEEHHHHHYPYYQQYPWYWGTTTCTSYGTSGSITLTAGTQNSATVNATNTSSGNSVNAYNMTSSVDSAKSMKGSLGTKFGEKSTHKVSEEVFVRASETPVEVLTISYDTREGLKRRGVDLDWTQPIAPSAFPKESAKYCEPPLDW